MSDKVTLADRLFGRYNGPPNKEAEKDLADFYDRINQITITKAKGEMLESLKRIYPNIKEKIMADKRRTYIVYTDKECPGIKVIADSWEIYPGGEIAFSRGNTDDGYIVAAFSKFHHMILEENE